MDAIDRQAQRETYWRAQLELLAERAAREHPPHPTWDAMERRLLRRYARLWREACGHHEQLMEAA